MIAGSISAALEDEVLREVRRRGIVVWLDKDAVYTPFVDGLAKRHAEGELREPVVPFRGSFLEVVLALEPFGNSIDNTPLLVHMPGFNEESIRTTPVLELYKAGFRFRKSLETLVREVARGRVLPDEIERFVTSPDLTLESAEVWLAAQVRGARTGLEELLGQMSLVVIADELLGKNTFLAESLRTGLDREVLAAFLHRQTGMDEAWIGFYGNDPAGSPINNLAAAFGAWLLCVEYANDLVRPPHIEPLRPLQALSPQLSGACVEVVQQLRARHPDRYAALADEVELHLHEELPAIRPEDLGKIDTFRIEEARVLGAAVDALKTAEWNKAGSFAAARVGESSFWLQRDQSRRFAWALVEVAAALGHALTSEARPLAGAGGLEDALARYTKQAFVVDRAHRRFEQQRLALAGAEGSSLRRLSRGGRGPAPPLSRLGRRAGPRLHGDLPEARFSWRPLAGAADALRAGRAPAGGRPGEGGLLHDRRLPLRNGRGAGRGDARRRDPGGPQGTFRGAALDHRGRHERPRPGGSERAAHPRWQRGLCRLQGR